MRAKIFLAAMAATALLWATPLTSHLRADDDDDDDRRGWRYGNFDDGDDDDDGNWNRGRGGYYIGPGGFSIGPGRFSIGVRPYGYSYGYGRSWSPGWGYSYGYPRDNYGYRGGYRTYGGYDDGDYDRQPGMSYSYDVQAAYEGPGVALRNKTDAELNFTIDDRRQMRIAPGETMRLTEKGRFLISFDRGSDSGSARYMIHEGLYEFTPADDGWELYRQKADDAIADRPNPAVIPRTAERPPAQELPRPRNDREFNDGPRSEAELPPAPMPY
jgi:hypothetical protein